MRYGTISGPVAGSLTQLGADPMDQHVVMKNKRRPRSAGAKCGQSRWGSLQDACPVQMFHLGERTAWKRVRNARMKHGNPQPMPASTANQGGDRHSPQVKPRLLGRSTVMIIGLDIRQHQNMIVRCNCCRLFGGLQDFIAIRYPRN